MKISEKFFNVEDVRECCDEDFNFSGFKESFVGKLIVVILIEVFVY